MTFFAGSLRVDSCNKKLAREALRLAKEIGVDGEFIDLKDYQMPVYDGDIQAVSGIPEGAVNLSKKILAADAIIISMPEYNGSMPGMFKNAVDWLSREKKVSLADKHLLLLAASPGEFGGIRGLWHSRQPLEMLGTHVFPKMMTLVDAYNAFDDQGRLKDEKNIKRLQDILDQFIKHVE